MEKETYTERFKVTDCDCDWNRKLTPGAFLRMVQQIATDHCNSLGMDEAFYAKEQAAFLMARMALKFYRVPKDGEMLTLTTLPEIMHRALYKRITIAVDEKGERVAVADSRWILVNTQTKKILRKPTGEFAKLPFAESVDISLDMKIALPETMEPCGTVRAVYSKCDQNMHMNNSRYADVTMDALPMEELKNKAAVEMIIQYHNELPAAESAQLQRAKGEGESWYVKGEREGKRCFEAKVKLL